MALPFITIQGKPAFLLDVVHRRFTILGITFLPTDGILLALLLLALFVSIFFFTALYGRIWCGWACPQTVYLELVYRPFQRLFHGTAGRGGPPRADLPAWRRMAYLGVSLLLSVFIANVFLAYFVGVDELSRWMTGSPAEHSVAFGVMSITTLAMLADFTWFREQMCIVVCPYGRFQSVMLDRHSLGVRYDRARGEPRRRGDRRAPSTLPRGDCVDCGLCARTCPTGIDIRDGLQLECIACASCIDACDGVMQKVGLPGGLIRFSTQALDEGVVEEASRPRLYFYPGILAVVVIAMVLWFQSRQPVDLTLLRSPGAPFVLEVSGAVSNNFRLRIHNRQSRPARFAVAIVGDPEASVLMNENPVTLGAGEAATAGVVVSLPVVRLEGGRHRIRLRVTDGDAVDRVVSGELLGPLTVEGGSNR